ncbi:DNA helicase [Alteromonas sp. KUL17]|uniref:UvrD-helicase domain-containing protein n=1 Tax=Alteromonas sp. KUL17 TaxID=2480796 RepID=UPI0010378A27|nr:UvrD-helicase domain-containing protein [Alteromonas sp. KUL17]TAP31106.1 ATP-dependent helicase [Alteromonas sp. KUL17]GEA01231.1 DNA helicase [Alteromonas sp. KUL17]
MIELISDNFPSHFDEVDREIYQYLNLDSPSSFLLFAGAGSGKTRTLVNVLEHVKRNDLNRMIDAGSRIAVITYTNAACEEIRHRLQFDPAFRVSTIHSFAWSLIKPFTEDIREFLRKSLVQKIAQLQVKIDKARDINGVTALKNARSRDSKKRRLEHIDRVTEFSYSPSSNRPEKDSLNHAEVIAIASAFIADSELMQTLLINKFPILLIDESQDTEKNLMNALISAQKNNKNKFVLGLFGDMMQRIYGGGKEDLDSGLPSDWKKPAKLINYRCPKRIVTLINDIRNDIDGLQQSACKDAPEGTVRLFIVNSSQGDKYQVEASIRAKMCEVTQDKMWAEAEKVKCLTLEHAMAADRGGFAEFYGPLAANADLRDSVLNGTSQELKFITQLVLPLVEAIMNDELFEITRLIKVGSAIISNSNTDFVKEPFESLSKADISIEKLKPKLVNEELNLREVIEYFSTNGLLEVPDSLKTHLDLGIVSCSEEEEKELEKDYIAWERALQAKIQSVKNYSSYINESSVFATHQGVKGLEFERVMAVLDDESAGGFLFNYEKLLGAEPLSDTDKKNEADGKDSTPLRTRRLFYVICSRAERSLAIVAYTKKPYAVKTKAIQSWFKEDEVVLLK